MLATIWVTTACNMKCKYCYEGVEKQRKILNIDTADKIMEFIFKKVKCNDNQDVKIVFHGGEPLLNMNIIEYIINTIQEKYKDFNVTYGITTNGLNIDNKNMTFLFNNVDDITVSIDGDKESHDLNRIDFDGNGTYERVVKNLKYINSKKSDLRIRMTVTSKTVNKLYENIVHLIDIGCNVIIPGIDYEDKEWDSQSVEVLYEQLIKIKQYLLEFQKESVYVAMLNKEEITKKKVCSGGRDNFNIAPDGKIYPCIYTVGNSKYKCGDVNLGIDEEKLKIFDEINIKEVRKCEGCTYYQYCKSVRCKYINEKLMGDFYKPSPIVCNVENVQLKVCSMINN